MLFAELVVTGKTVCHSWWVILCVVWPYLLPRAEESLRVPKIKIVVPEATTTRTCPQSAVGCFCGFSLVLAIFLWDIEDFWKEDGKGWMDYCQNNLFDQHPALEKKVELLTGSLWPRSCRWGSLVLQIMFPVLPSISNSPFGKIKGIFWIAVSQYMASNVSWNPSGDGCFRVFACVGMSY